jgi:curli biogenesis system outer membrane secretion channel CsgG
MWSIICLALCLGAAFAPMQYTSTAAAEVAKAKATALTESPTSNIARKTFNRFVTICRHFCANLQCTILTLIPVMENTDYDTAAADREFSMKVFFEEYV